MENLTRKKKLTEVKKSFSLSKQGIEIWRVVLQMHTIFIKMIFGLFLIQWKIGDKLMSMQGHFCDVEYAHLAEQRSQFFDFLLFFLTTLSCLHIQNSHSCKMSYCSKGQGFSFFNAYKQRNQDFRVFFQVIWNKNLFFVL